MGAQAIQSAAKDVETLEEKEKRLARTGYRMTFAGTAMLTFAALTTKAMTSLMATTTRGQFILDDFTESFNRLKTGLGEVIVNKFGSTIDDITKKLDELSENETWLKLTGGLVVDLTLALGTIGVGMITAGAVSSIASSLVTALNALKIVGLAGSLATGAAVASGAIITITITAALLIIIKNIVISSEAYKKATEKWENFRKKISEELGGEVTMESFAEAEYFPRFYFEGKQIPRSQMNQFYTSFFINNLNTKADEEELADVISRLITNAYENQNPDFASQIG